MESYSDRGGMLMLGRGEKGKGKKENKRGEKQTERRKEVCKDKGAKGKW